MKEHFFITEYGDVYSLNEYEGLNNVANVDDYKQIGNYFDTPEEAEKAVEKLRAWKRLKDNGFKFKGTTTSCYENPCIEYETKFDYTYHYDRAEYKEMEADLDLLFGVEE